MEIKLNIDEALIRHAVNTQVDSAVAKFAEDRINAMVTEIVEKKFGRVDVDTIVERLAHRKFDDEIEDAINLALGTSYNRRELIKTAMNDVLTRMIKEAVK